MKVTDFRINGVPWSVEDIEFQQDLQDASGRIWKPTPDSFPVKITMEDLQMIGPNKFKQLVISVLCPWKVWELHQEIRRLKAKNEAKADTIRDLLGDIETAVAQKKVMQKMARKSLFKKDN